MLSSSRESPRPANDIYLDPGVRPSDLTFEVLPFVASSALTATGDHRRLSILPIRPAGDILPVWLGGWIHCPERKSSSLGRSKIFPVGFPTLFSLPEASCPAFSYLELTLTFGSRSGIQNSRFQKRRLDRFYGNQEEEIIHS